MGFFESVGDFFSGVKDSVGGVLGAVASTAKEAVAAVHQDLRDIIGGVHGDIRDTASSAKEAAFKVLDTGANVANNISKLPGQAVDTAGNTLNGLFNSPFVIVGLGVAAVMLVTILPSVLSAKTKSEQ